MEVDINKLKKALSLIREDDKGNYYFPSKFNNLIINLYHKSLSDVKYNKANSQILYINIGLWNLSLIPLKLEYWKELRIKKEIDTYLWSEFVTSEMHLFHVQFRSLFDNIARLLKYLSKYPDQIPGSFNRLKNTFLKDPDNVKKLGKELSNLVISCDWFEVIKDVRDFMIHKEIFMFAFPIKSKILINIVNDEKIKDIIPEQILDDNDINFKLYVGLFLGYLISYLEDMADCIYEVFEFKQILNEASNYCRGYKTVKEWITDLINKLKED